MGQMGGPDGDGGGGHPHHHYHYQALLAAVQNPNQGLHHHPFHVPLHHHQQPPLAPPVGQSPSLPPAFHSLIPHHGRGIADG